MFEDLSAEELMSEIEDYLEKYKNKDIKHKNRKENSKLSNLINNEFEEIISDINKEIQELIIHKNYTQAEKLISIVKRLGKIKDKLLEDLLLKYSSTSQEDKESTRKSSTHKRITPMEKFYLPILEVLYELGGRGVIKEVIERVGIKMRDILTPCDYEYLPSGRSIRWENKVQWARLSLVQKGLLKRDSPRGIWELSEKRYKYILEAKKRE